MGQKRRRLSEEEHDALSRICDLILPESITITRRDILNGYSKKKATEMVMEAAEDEAAITSLKMMAVYTVLRKCYVK